MFDFSFSEVALIGVVALVVIGPERLPRVARTAGVLVNRAQRYATTVRAEIEREVDLSEMRRVQGDLQSAAQSFQSGVRDSLAKVESEFEQSRAAVMTALPGAHAEEPYAEEPHAAGGLSGAPAESAAVGHAATQPADLGARLAFHAPGDDEPQAGQPSGERHPPLPLAPDLSPMGWERMLGPAATRTGHAAGPRPSGPAPWSSPAGPAA